MEGHCPHGYSCCPNGCPGQSVCVLASPSNATVPQVHRAVPRHQVNVSLVFSTASPLSYWLLQYQVLPVMAALFPFVSLEQVPVSNGQQDGECQYGAPECLGNMLVSCATWHQRNQSAVVAFAACLTMDTALVRGGNATMVLKKALKCLQYQPEVWNKVVACASTDEGLNLFMAAWNRQKEIGVAYDGIPVVAFNGEAVISNVENLGRFKEFICYSLWSNKKVQNTCRYLLQDGNVAT